MGLFSTKCDICFIKKSFVSKNSRGVKICNECKKTILKKMPKTYYEYASYSELLYASNNNSLTLKKSIIESKEMSAADILKEISPEADEVGIALAKDELCFYKGFARSKKIKSIVTKYNRKSLGFSIKIMKGLYVKPGTGVTTPIREDIEETYEGNFYITNKRLILLTPKYGFDVKREKISTIEPYDNWFRLYVGEKSYDVITFDIDNIISILKISNQLLLESNDQDLNDL